MLLLGDIKSEQTNETFEEVNLVPTSLTDTCGYEHHVNISLKCSGHHDVKKNKIESKCTTLVPKLPTCNKTEIGMIEIIICSLK